MKHNFNRKILALILSAAMMLNSGAMAFATEDGTAGEPTVTTSETVTATEEPSSTDTTTTPESKPESSSSEPQSSSSEQENAGGEQGDLSDPKGSDNALPGEGVKEPVCTCDPAPGASGVEGHQEDCPLYVPECTCPPVDSGEVVHKEGCPLYVAPPMMKAPRTADAITIKIKNGAEVGGDSLQAAVDNWRGTTYTYEAVTQLTITAGKVRASDWEWINILERLTEFTIEEGVTVEAIPDLSVNCIFSTTIREVTIPQSIKIGSFAFNGCEALETVNIPKATSIGESAFSMCSKLKRVNFPTVTSIGKMAFFGCTELANTDFPTAATIGESAFNGCSLRTATFPAAASIGEKTFNACPSPRYLKLLDANGNALTGEALTAARTEYDAVDDGTEGYATDGLWYGWSIPAEPVVESKITITVTDGTNEKTGIGGTSLSDAITKSGLTASTIKTLTITAGEVTTADWEYFAGGTPGTTVSPFTALETFEIVDDAEVTKVENIPNGDFDKPIFPTTIKTVNISHVATIGECVFNECASLTSASFPDAITIEKAAFFECTVLELATTSFPKATSIGKLAFKGCTGLATASFLEATSIGANAFDGCTALTTANFPKATSIGQVAFYGCSKLTTASFPEATSIGQVAFDGCAKLTTVSFPAAMTIVQAAFQNCTELTTVSLPAAKTIEGDAFKGCTKLATLKLGATVPTGLGSNTFSGCLKTTLTLVDASGNELTDATALANAQKAYDDVTANGNVANDGMWYGWKVREAVAESKITILVNGTTTASGASLSAAITASKVAVGSVKTLTITAGEVTKADWATVTKCVALTDFTVGAAVTEVADIPDSSPRAFPITIEKVNIPQVKNIGNKAFSTCTALTTANFPAATSIGEYAFIQCESLTEVNFPNVTSIGKNAFSNCTVLDSPDFPAVTSIGESAFNYCKGLTSISFYKAAIVSIGDSAFGFTKLATLKLGATPPKTVGKRVFNQCPTPRDLTLVDANGNNLKGKALTDAQALYKAADDDYKGDNLWFGWTLTGGGTTVPVTGVTLNKTALSLETGKSETLTATIAPANATNKAVTWKSSDTAVATVDTNGLVSALKAGAATITVTTTDGGMTATCAVTVTAKTTATAPGGKLEAPLTQDKLDEVFGKDNATLSPDGSIKINNDITVEKPIIVPAPITIDMGGKDMTGGAGANPVIKIDGGTGTITGGGSITGGDGGAGVEVGGGEVIIGGGTVINGGGSSTGDGGSGITGDGSVVIGGGGSGSGGGSANGGNGGGNGSGPAGGNGGAGVDVGGDIEIGSGGSATGGDGSGTGSGGDGANSSTGGITIDGGKAEGGNGGTNGGSGGDGVDTSGGSGGIIINGGGSSTGGNGGNNSSGTGGSGGNGATSGGGSIDVGDGASSEGGTGGNGSTAGGTGGNGTATGGTDTTIDGGATGGNGGNGTGNGNGGNGGDGAHQGNGTVDGSGSATGGNGGSGAGTGSGGSGGAGVGGGATVGDDLTVKNGISTKIEVTGDAGVKVELPNTKETVDAVLTDEEKADKTITDVKVTLKVDDKTADKPNKDAVETAKPSGSIVGAFFDITLKKTVTNGSGTITTDVTDTNSKMITITIEIPTGMRDGVTDSYVVIRVHNGTAAKLTTTQSGDNLTFNTDQFSTYAIAYTKNVTPPTPPTDNTGGGGNSSDNSEYDFWMSVKDKINNADSGDVIKVSAKTNDKMPESVMDALRKNPGVTLVISWSGGKTVTIPAGKAQKREAGRIYYPLSLLAELYQGIEYVEAPADIGKLNPETGGTGYIAYANGKQIPMTGGVAQLDAPAIDAPNAITPEAPAAITPPTAGFEPDAFAGTPDAARANSGNPFTVIALMLAAAAVGGGVWFWKKRREEEQSNET